MLDSLKFTLLYYNYLLLSFSFELMIEGNNGGYNILLIFVFNAF